MPPSPNFAKTQFYMNSPDSSGSAVAVEPASSLSSLPVLGRVRIVLCRTSHPGNIGSAARAMKTMGLHRLYLAQPLCAVDDTSRALASGADDVLDNAIVCATLDEALAGCTHVVAVSARRREIGPPPQWPAAAMGEVLQRIEAEEAEVALLFGNESNGLSNEEVQRGDRLAMIPSQPGFSSLNLAAAVQVFAYELRMAALAGSVALPVVTGASARATQDEVSGFFTHLERVMVATGFLDPHEPKRLVAKLRRLFGRVELEKDEVNILRGILTATEQPADHPARRRGADNLAWWENRRECSEGTASEADGSDRQKS